MARVRIMVRVKVRVKTVGLILLRETLLAGSMNSGAASSIT